MKYIGSKLILSWLFYLLLLLLLGLAIKTNNFGFEVKANIGLQSTRPESWDTQTLEWTEKKTYFEVGAPPKKMRHLPKSKILLNGSKFKDWRSYVLIPI